MKVSEKINRPSKALTVEKVNIKHTRVICRQDLAEQAAVSTDQLTNWSAEIPAAAAAVAASVHCCQHSVPLDSVLTVILH